MRQSGQVTERSLPSRTIYYAYATAQRGRRRGSHKPVEFLHPIGTLYGTRQLTRMRIAAHLWSLHIVGPIHPRGMVSYNRDRVYSPAESIPRTFTDSARSTLGPEVGAFHHSGGSRSDVFVDITFSGEGMATSRQEQSIVEAARLLDRHSPTRRMNLSWQEIMLYHPWACTSWRQEGNAVKAQSGAPAATIVAGTRPPAKG